jgi:hypothetical protein
VLADEVEGETVGVSGEGHVPLLVVAPATGDPRVLCCASVFLVLCEDKRWAGARSYL